ncbi:MAG: type II glyceraldehyde-3-phosphate dehydrogenase, partial [Candidatus Aenigmatarchaeota archaeon]
GIGVIGKRVAHAVKLQKDMNLVGISDVAATFVLRTVLEPKGPLYGTPLYCSLPEKLEEMRGAGMIVEGTLEDLLKSGEVDLVVDAAPAGIEKYNKPLYEKYGVKAIFQGGAKHELTGVSFNSLANYKEVWGKDYVRVVSCNTTSLIRTIYPLMEKRGIEEVVASLVRRAVDPWNPNKGPINAIVPVMKVPSHHGPDVKSVIPELNIKTLAVKVPTTLAHVHVVHGKLKEDVERDEILELFRSTPRVLVLRAADGYSSTAEVIERFRDLCRPRYDMYEVVVWEETVSSEGSEVFWSHAVHSEAIVIPENIDCIRAMMEMEEDNLESIRKTDKALGY